MWQPDDRDALELLGDWIARWRTSVGVSQRSLANRAGISQGGLSRVERGLQACGARRLGRLIRALDQLSRQSPMGTIDPPPIRRPPPDRRRAGPEAVDAHVPGGRGPDTEAEILPRSYVDEWLGR